MSEPNRRRTAPSPTGSHGVNSDPQSMTGLQERVKFLENALQESIQREYAFAQNVAKLQHRVQILDQQVRQAREALI